MSIPKLNLVFLCVFVVTAELTYGYEDFDDMNMGPRLDQIFKRARYNKPMSGESV